MARERKDSGVSWIGEIPAEWELLRLKYLCSMQAGKNLTTMQISPEGQYPVYGGNGIRGYFSEYNCEGDCLLVGRQGALCGNVHKVQGFFWATEHAAVTRNSQKADFSFLFYLLVGMNLNQYASNVAAQPGLSVTAVLNVVAVLPPLSEQHRIAAFLDTKCATIDNILDKTRSSIEEYKRLKQSVITQAVTKGVRGKREMKDSGIAWIGMIPTEWSVSKLKHLWLSVDSGVSVNAADKPVETVEQYGVLKTSSVSKFVFKPYEHKQVELSEYNRVSCPVTRDTIIVSRMNTPDLVGACGYVEEDYPHLFLPDRLWKISFNEKVHTKYMWYFLCNSRFRNYISSLSTGTSSSMQNISQPQLGSTFAVVPCVPEQQEIAAYLDTKCAEIDTLITKKEQLLTELETYKKSLIYEYVTGKKEVPHGCK